MYLKNKPLFSELQTRLANWYIQEYSHIPFAPSRPEHEVTMRQLYVAPRIVDKGQKPNKNSNSTVNTFNDFFKKEGSLCKSIFLLGEPGTGKSTFLQNLALQWSELQVQQDDTEMGRRDQVFANDEHGPSDDRRRRKTDDKNENEVQDKTTLKKIDVLFYVSLRDANKYCDYEDIINDQLLRHIYRKDELESANNLVERLLETPSSFVLSDGLDEWEHPSNGDCPCPARDKGRTPLIHHTNSATIVTTSRPWRLAQNAPRSSKVEKFLEIEGTSYPDKLGQKVVDVLNEQEGKCLRFEDVQTYVRDKGVSTLMKVPILLLQIVCLFFDGTEVSNSQCKIYASIFDMMIGRHRQTLHDQSSTCDTGMSLFTNKVNIREFWTQFTALAKLAFEQLFRQQGHSSVVFNSNTCNLDNSVRTFACVCGLLTEKKSRAFSSPVSHLSFTHKTFQEFLAALYMSINEELFETVIKPRYAVVDQGSLRRCLSDLAQVFIFTCGLNIQMAEKIATLFNNHYRSDMPSSITYEYPWWSMLSYMYCQNIQDGIAEADRNGFKHFTFRLQCIDVAIRVEKEATVCRRLLDMNIERLVSVFIRTNRYKFSLDNMVKVTGGISLQNCTRLQSLQLRGLDLGDQQLLLPDTLTNIEMEDVKVTGGISLQNCTRLQRITLLKLDLGDQQLLLPDTLTNIDFENVKVRGGISLQNCTRLPSLKLCNIDLGDQQLLLPDTLTHIDVKSVNVTGGIYLQNCTRLQILKLRYLNLGDQQLLLPDTLTNMEMENVKVTGGIYLQNCSLLQNLKLTRVRFGENEMFFTAQNFKHLQELELVQIDLGDQELLLSNSLTSVCLDRVSTASGRNGDRNTFAQQQQNEDELAAILSFKKATCLGPLRLQNCTKLKTIVLKDINMSDQELLLPEGITSITLDHVNKSKGVKLPLQHCTSLQKLKFTNIKLGDKLRLPDSITEIELFGCLSTLTSLQNLSRVQTVSLSYMDLGDLELKFPVTVKHVNLYRLEMSKGLLLHNCSQLIKLNIFYMNLANTELKLPDSITNITMTCVTMSALGVQELCHHFQRLPHAMTFEMLGCTIEPLHDYEFIQRLKTMTDVQVRNLEKGRILGDVSFKVTV